MRYVDGYVLPVRKKNLKAYLRMARMGEKVWRKHGALDYKECVGDDLKTRWGLPFSRMITGSPRSRQRKGYERNVEHWRAEGYAV